jgi:hypothetical protein
MDSQFARLLQRVHRVIESNDAAAIQAINGFAGLGELMVTN